MKVIIAGSRNVTDYAEVLFAVVDAGFEISEFVSGNCPEGVDALGEQCARKEFGKEPTLFPADWRRYGKAAGMRRNTQMAKYADALIAIWDGVSPGTANMISTMCKLGKLVYIHYVY